MSTAGEVRWLRVTPPLLALAYPAIIGAGTALSPLFLLIALVVPVAAVVVVRRTSARFPRARMVALAAVTAPALFSWLGGLLDFQTVLPVRAGTIWVPLWTALLVIAALESPAVERTPTAGASRLAFLHGVSASVVTLFVVAHLANHLAALAGGDMHIAVMGTLRLAYRQPWVETVLLMAFVFQASSGLRLLALKPVAAPSWPDTLQRASGAYLAMFLLSHLTAALRARHWRGTDTNWLWLTSDSLLTDPWSARLAPYYFLGVVAVGVHAGLGLGHVLRGHGVAETTAHGVSTAVTLVATVAAGLIMSALLRG